MPNGRGRREGGSSIIFTGGGGPFFNIDIAGLLTRGFSILIADALFGRRRRRRQLPGFDPNLPPGALGQAMPAPVPAPPSPVGLPAPGGLERVFGEFGRVANDPVFRRLPPAVHSL